MFKSYLNYLQHGGDNILYNIQQTIDNIITKKNINFMLKYDINNSKYELNYLGEIYKIDQLQINPSDLFLITNDINNLMHLSYNADIDLNTFKNYYNSLILYYKVSQSLKVSHIINMSDELIQQITTFAAEVIKFNEVVIIKQGSNKIIDVSKLTDISEISVEYVLDADTLFKWVDNNINLTQDIIKNFKSNILTHINDNIDEADTFITSPPSEGESYTLTNINPNKLKNAILQIKQNVLYIKLFVEIYKNIDTIEQKYKDFCNFINDYILYKNILKTSNVLYQLSDYDKIINVAKEINKNTDINTNISNLNNKYADLLIYIYSQLGDTNKYNLTGGNSRRIYNGGAKPINLKNFFTTLIQTINTKEDSKILELLKSNNLIDSVTYNNIKRIQSTKSIVHYDNVKDIQLFKDILNNIDRDQGQDLEDAQISLIPFKTIIRYNNYKYSQELTELPYLINYNLINSLVPVICSSYGIDILKLNMNKIALDDILKEDEKNPVNSLTDLKISNLYYKFRILTQPNTTPASPYIINYNILPNILKTSLSFRDKINVYCKLIKLISSNDILSTYELITTNTKINDIIKNGNTYIQYDSSNTIGTDTISTLINSHPKKTDIISAIKISFNHINYYYYALINTAYLIVNYEVLIILDLLLNKPQQFINILPILLNSEFYKTKDNYIKSLYIIKSLLYKRIKFNDYMDENNINVQNLRKSYFNINTDKINPLNDENFKQIHKIIIKSITRAKEVLQISDIDTELTDFVNTIDKVDFKNFNFEFDLVKAIPKIINKSNITSNEISILSDNYDNLRIGSNKNMVFGGLRDDKLLDSQREELYSIYYNDNKDDNKYNMYIWGTYMLLYCILNTSVNIDSCAKVLGDGIGLKEEIISFIQNMKLETKIKILHSVGMKFNKSGNKFTIQSFEEYISDHPNIFNDTKLVVGGAETTYARFYENNPQIKNAQEQRKRLFYYIVHLLIDSVMYKSNGSRQDYQKAINILRTDYKESEPIKTESIFDKFQERSKRNTSNLINNKSIKLFDPDAWLNYSNDNTLKSDLISGGGYYSNAFNEFYTKYKTTLKNMGYKMSSKDQDAFEKALRNLEEAEDKLQNYFTKYKYVISHMKDIKDKLDGTNITESSIASIKKQINDAAAEKQKKQDVIVKMIQVLKDSGYAYIPGTTTSIEFTNVK